MRTERGAVKIADFGIATAYDELANANLTPLGEFVGAPGYVSPEQVLGKTATAASDLYSVGVIAFELFTGAVPFAETGGGSALLVGKVNQRAPSLSSLRPDLDKRLAEWVDRLLERDPGRRPDSADRRARGARGRRRERARDRVGGAKRRFRADSRRTRPTAGSTTRDAPHARALAPAARERPDPAAEPPRRRRS